MEDQKGTHLDNEGEEKKMNENEDNLDKALDDFDEPLNLTVDGKDDEEEAIDPELEKGFKLFMDSLKEGEGGANEADLMKNFTSKFGDLLAGLSEGGEGGDTSKNPLLGAFSGNPANDKEFEEFSKKINEKMGGAAGGGEGPVLEKLADEFLHMFMEKDILEEPLKEARESYETYLAKMPDNVAQEDKDRYLNQYDCLKKLLQILEKTPDKKEELIKAFEKMQEYGNPPDDIVNAMGKDPLNAMNFAQIFSNKSTDGDIPLGADPNLGVPNDGDAPCNIF